MNFFVAFCSKHTVHCDSESVTRSSQRRSASQLNILFLTDFKKREEVINLTRTYFVYVCSPTTSKLPNGFIYILLKEDMLELVPLKCRQNWFSTLLKIQQKTIKSTFCLILPYVSCLQFTGLAGCEVFIAARATDVQQN